MASDILSRLISEASDVELQDFISERLTKAEALSNCTYGTHGDAFRGMNDALQDNFLWALSDMLFEANEARSEVLRRDARSGSNREFVEIPVIGRAS